MAQSTEELRHRPAPPPQPTQNPNNAEEIFLVNSEKQEAAFVRWRRIYEQVIGCEPAGADDAFRSIRDNKIYPSVNPKTIADGLLTSLGEKTFAIIKENVSRIFIVQEESIISAMRLIWERMKIIVEPSAAVPLAVIIENKDFFANKKIAIILSGGNVDVENLPF